MQYGKHLLAEAIVANPKILSNKNLIRRIFKQICRAIKVTPVLPPIIYQFPKKQNVNKNTAGGLTAIYIIAESHLAIHTWPENNYFAFDLFSCRNFNEKIVIRILKKNFKILKITCKIVARGFKAHF